MPWWRFRLPRPRTPHTRDPLVAFGAGMVVYLILWPYWAIAALLWWTVVASVFVLAGVWLAGRWLLFQGVALYADHRREPRPLP